MNIHKLQPVIMCGGSGTRLWPLSTLKMPKQFITLGNKGTLLEQTINRILKVNDKCQEEGYHAYSPILIMHKDHILPPELESYKNDIVYEEYANDTAVAVAKVSTFIKNRYNDDNVILLVMPADHYIENVEAFVYDIVEGITRVTDDNIVLYGIEPTSPETKYGYIIPGSTMKQVGQPGTNKVDLGEDRVRFREKPDVTTAQQLITQNALWNSGIFCSNLNTVLRCLQTSSSNIMDWVIHPREGKAPSFDVAVLQEYHKIYAHYCLKWNWSDVGTWQSFIEIPEIRDQMKDTSGVITSECSNVNVLNRNHSNIVVIGCQNLLVITNGSNILIMPITGDYNSQLKEIATHIDKHI